VHPQIELNAWALALRRWQNINGATRIIKVPAGHFSYNIATPEPFGKERIELHRCAGVEPIVEIGYGPQTDTLVYGVEL